MPKISHEGPKGEINEIDAMYVLGCAVSSILYIVRSYLYQE